MPQRVSIPNIGILEFPDDMSQDQIATAIQKNFPEIHGGTQTQQPMEGIDPVGADLSRQFETGEFSPEMQKLFSESEQAELAYQPFGAAALGAQTIGQPDRFQDDTEWRSVISRAVGRTPGSAVDFIKDVVTPILHPVETTKSLWKLGEGIGEKFIEGEQENEQRVDAMVNFFKDRYGSVENFKETLAQDPVGVIGDLSVVLSAGGTGLTTAGKVGKASRLSEIGKALETAGRVVDPAVAAGRAAKTAAKAAIPAELPSKLYQSAAKFSTTIPEADRAKLAKTALDNEIMPSVRGLDKARTQINEFNEKITGLIETATQKGERIPVQSLFKDFRELKRKISSDPILREKQISNVAKNLGSHFKRLGKKDITPEEAQALKQAIYQELESFYSKVKNAPAKVEAKQAVARAAKENLEVLFPEIKELNRNEGSLIELRKQIERSASRITNRDLLGIGVPIKGGAGGAVAGPAGMASGLAIGLLDTPLVKAKLAIVANRLKKKGVVLADNSLLKRMIEVAPTASEARASGVVEGMAEEEMQ